MFKFNRNDKVYVLYKYIATPKFSLRVEIPIAKILIIKRIFNPYKNELEYWYYCDYKNKLNRDPEFHDHTLPISEDILFKYTKIGELLYG